ncbi:MAG: hypothetical protein ACLQF0_10715 [Dissulfurispiraceae bacterium]
MFIVRSLFLILALALLAGCGGSSGSSSYVPSPLSAGNINLIFVVSDDLAYNASGDINPSTANLTNQGLQRSLLMATYLQQQVLGAQNVTGIYVLEPMTHLQTANNYPDMVAIWSIQQFALLNQVSLSIGTGTPYTGNSYPLNASYASGYVPKGVATPLFSCPGCQGLDFNDTGGNNEALIADIVKANVPGFYVFSAPWETTIAMLANINKLYGYNLNIPASYISPNYVYAISISTYGGAGLVTYNSNLNPPSTYPVLPSPVAGASCTAQAPFSITVTGGSNGAVIPKGINTNETVYLIRHAEAHPWTGWDDGNYVGAGQWRALYLPNALKGKISPTQVFSIDPAQVYPDSLVIAGNPNSSYVRPSLTVEPYAIANNLPYYLVSGLEIFNITNSPQLTSNFFFFGSAFSNQVVLLAWEHGHFPPTVDALVSSYFPSGGGQTAPAWPDSDYDTIWTVTLDAKGNLTVNNALCEGIDSTQLPVTAPQF